jgi:uncharacterized protein YgiM (DUF1202 family)
MTTATTTTELNLRSGIGTSHPVLVTIPSGATVTITGAISSGWYPVTYGGKAGWVSGNYLENIVTTPDPPTQPAEQSWMPDLRQILYDYVMDQIGKPYDWGGSNAVDGAEAQEGMDCSGFTTIILQSQDVMGEQERLSAQSQYNRWKANAVTLANVDLGDLVFYGSSTGNITHVMLVLNKTLCIGAQGGGEATKTIGDAVATDGYVRTRKIDYRSDRVAIVRPPWPFHG